MSRNQDDVRSPRPVRQQAALLRNHGCRHHLRFRNEVHPRNGGAAHATQVVDHVFTPVVVAHDDRLTIALGVELQDIPMVQPLLKVRLFND